MTSLEAGDATIVYDSQGSGPPLLLLAATAFHGGVWKLFDLPDLARDHQVIAFDQRGTGASTTRSQDFTTTALAQDALALLDKLDIERAHLFGHSNGGRVAQYLAIHHPDRVASLILASAGGTHKTRGISVDMCRNLVERGYEGYSRNHAIKTGCSSSDPVEQARAEAFLHEFIGHLAPLETFLRYVVSRQEADTTSALDRIAVPVMVLVGENEGKLPGDSHMNFALDIKEKIPTAILHVFAGQGHFYPFLQPAKVHDLVRSFILGNL